MNVILLPKISNPLVNFTCILSYNLPFIKYIFMFPSSTFSNTHNYFFLFEFVFNLNFSFIVFLSTFLSALSVLLSSPSTHLFSNISVRLRLSLFYHMHLTLLFSLHVKFVVVSCTAFCCLIFSSFCLSPFRICMYCENYLNPLKTKCRLFYLKTQFVPRSKHSSSRL